MTKPRRLVAFSAAALAAGALAACAPSHAASLAPLPARSNDDEIAEIRSRHNDIIDGLRTNDVAKVLRQLAPDAVLVLPSRDTVRGPTAIGAQVQQLFKAYKIEAVRATAGARVVQCTDGMLERTGDWSLQILKPDQSRDYPRNTFGVRWKSVGDSLRISMISLSVKNGLSKEDAHCTSVDAVRYSKSRVAAFAILGVAAPASYTKSAEQAYSAVGFGVPNVGDPANYPEGLSAVAPNIVGVSGRLDNAFWLTAETSLHSENNILGRLNTTTDTYVNINRLHRPVGLNLDYHWKAVVVGAGPALTDDHLFYQEVKRDSACPAGTGVECPLNLINRTETHVGTSGSVSYNVGIGPHAAISARFQLFRFPTQPFPALTARVNDPLPAGAAAVGVRDLSTVFGIGLKFSY